MLQIELIRRNQCKIFQVSIVFSEKFPKRSNTSLGDNEIFRVRKLNWNDVKLLFSKLLANMFSDIVQIYFIYLFIKN